MVKQSVRLVFSLAHSLFFFISISFTLYMALKVGLEARRPTLAWAVRILARPQSSGPPGPAGRS